MMGGWGWNMGLLGGLVMFLFWALFIGLLIWLVIILTRTTQSQPPRNPTTADPPIQESYAVAWLPVRSHLRSMTNCGTNLASERS